VTASLRVGVTTRRTGVKWTAASLAIAFLALMLLGGCAGGEKSPTPSESPNAPKEEAAMLRLSSPAYEDGGLIPVEYANTGVPGGQNVSIPFEWSGTPEGTKSFALVLVDRYPAARSWIHWMVTSVPADENGLPRGASGQSMPSGSTEQRNTFGEVGYGGPQPPAGTGKHEYEAVLYALDVSSVSTQPRTLEDLNRALDGHVLASATWAGMFGR